jgi:hypothetical protein
MASLSLLTAALSRQTAGRTFARDVLGPVIAAVAFVIWFIAVDTVNYRQMTDLGLLSVLPPAVLLAIAALTLCFLHELTRTPIRTPVALFFIVALIIKLFGVTAIVEPVPRFESAWKHVGVTDYILRTGSVDPHIDAYFNWPGFFILIGLITDLGGFNSPLRLIDWAPVVFNLLYLGPLLMIFRHATSDQRLVWLGVWFFYVGNWVGQDYLSPQAFGYFLYLMILAILITWFPVPETSPSRIVGLLRRFRLSSQTIERLIHWLAPPDLPAAPATRRQQRALVAVVVVLYTAVVASHQLTPFAILGAVMILVIFNRCILRFLPIIMALLAFIWLFYMASTYMAGHGGQRAEQIGAVGDSFVKNMSDRLSGSTGHLVVVYLRSTASLIFWGLAGFGVLRRIRHQHRDFTFALLAAAPFPLLLLQSYGGEMLLRIYFFSLPFMAFFVAALFVPAPDVGHSRVAQVTLSITVLLLLTSFFITRYGNERMDAFTPAEVEATTYLYDTAPPDSLLLAGTTKTPWKHRDYERYTHRTLAYDVDWDWDADLTTGLSQIEAAMGGSQYPATFLVITRSQVANDEMFELLPYRLEDIVKALSASDRFQILYANDDAIIFILAPADSEASP